MNPIEMASKGREASHQKALFVWAAMAQNYGINAANDMIAYKDNLHLARTYSRDDAVKELRWLHAIPNGGLRNKKVALELKAEGVKAGVLDIFLPVARRDKHGFYIEMKVGSNKPSLQQMAFKDFVEIQQYATAVCYSWREAADAITNYLTGVEKWKTLS